MRHAVKEVTRVRTIATWKTVLAFIVALVLTPATIVAGQLLGGSNSYYITSVLVIVYTMVPFFVSFESRRPQARELVIIAVLCAIAVASRAVFFFVPHFKPIVGIVIIAGIAFGAQAGFLTGAVSAFVSNFIFGQGPWTPWQMLAFGLAGFVFGFLADRGVIPRCGLSAKAKTVLAVCGALFIVCIVGPLLDTSSLFTMVAMLTPEAAAAIYISGFPVNCIHASCVFLTLLLVSNPLLDKLERVKVKYGMME